MQHADGERPGELRRPLAGDPEAQRKLEALGELRDLVRGHLELTTDETDDRKFQELWRRIDRAVDAEAPRSLWGRVSSWLDRAPRPPHHRGRERRGGRGARAGPAASIPAAGGEPMEHGVIDVRPVSMRSPPAIEALDTPDGTGTVLNHEDEDGHTAVIWVTPADTVEGI